jgi:hypothetical protein
MPDDKLTPAETSSTLSPSPFCSAAENAFTTATTSMARIAADRIVRHLEQSGYVVMKRPPSAGGGAIGRGFEG